MENLFDKINNFKKSIALKLPKNISDKLNKAIEDEVAVPPKIAVIGKAGVGKTTTINSLFNVEWHTSETITGTTKVQMETFDFEGNSKLTIIDMPGLGDSKANDKEFIEIYKKMLPSVDVIFYIIQADDRGLGEDERIIKEVISKCGNNICKNFVIGINKVDLLGKNIDLKWNNFSNLPSEEQENYIKKKCEETIKRLSKATDVKEKAITYFSATKCYNLYSVLNTIITQSGLTGWKIPINPKDWLNLAHPDFIQTVNEEDKKIKENN